MGRSKSKKRLKREETTEDPTSTEVPIANLPAKFLRMRVKSGTKIRNVLGYALKEFPSYNSIVWTGIGEGIAKAISCAELFKRKHEGLHQVTKLRYVRSESSKENTTAETRRIPEIYILLTKDIKDTTESGYQAPEDCGEFSEKKDTAESKMSTTEDAGTATCIDTEKFAAMRLKIGKRNKRNNNEEPPSKRNKKSIA